MEWRSEAGAASEASETLEPDAQLVQQCLQGNGLAWEKLVRAHTRRIYNLCYRFTGHRPEAEAMTQEVFLRVYRTLVSFYLEQDALSSCRTHLTRTLLSDHSDENMRVQ